MGRNPLERRQNRGRLVGFPHPLDGRRGRRTRVRVRTTPSQFRVKPKGRATNPRGFVRVEILARRASKGGDDPALARRANIPTTRLTREPLSESPRSGG